MQKGERIVGYPAGFYPVGFCERCVSLGTLYHSTGRCVYQRPAFGALRVYAKPIGPPIMTGKDLRIAVNGYGVVGKRVADAVAAQDDMTLARITGRLLPEPQAAA